VRGAASPRILTALLASAACVVLLAAVHVERALAVSAPSLSVRAAGLIEQTSGRQLYGVAADRQVAIASTTKLMTALVTLEQVHRLGVMFTQNDYYPAAVDSQLGLVPGERTSVHDLLLAMLLPSADDAAEDLAYNVGHGSVGRFIAMMNARARELGLVHTHYTTPIGLDTPGNYSTASDLLKLASYVLHAQPFFARAVALPRAVLHTGNHVRVVTNRNDLVSRFPWINGVKTGHTLDAGYVLIASGTRGGMTLIDVVLGTASEADRDANALALLDYGFANFRIIKPVIARTVVARPSVRDQPGMHATVIAASTFTDVVRRDARVTKKLKLPQQLAGPLRQNTVVGTLVVLLDGHPVARIPLLLARALPAVSPLTLAGRFITRPSTLVLLLVLIGVGIVVAMRRRGRTTRTDVERPEPA
jgi:serine-type D-Ala-D-Ala carboxypeptidase (penicillin-binding protein 5/6)